MRRKPGHWTTIMEMPPHMSCTSIRCARKCPRQREPSKLLNRLRPMLLKMTILRSTLAKTSTAMASAMDTTIA